MTIIQRVLGGAGVAAALVLVGVPAAQADGLYPPSVQPSQVATVTPQDDPADPAVANDSLAFTGSDVAVVGGTAALLVVAGAALVARSRRRGEHV